VLLFDYALPLSVPSSVSATRKDQFMGSEPESCRKTKALIQMFEKSIDSKDLYTYFSPLNKNLAAARTDSDYE